MTVVPTGTVVGSENQWHPTGVIQPVLRADPQTPLWWVHRLYKQLQDRQPQIATYQRYVDGNQDAPSVEEKASRAFRRILGLSVTNLCGLIVSAAAERLTVQGFRFGDDPEADAKAWEIWQASDFDAASQLAFHAGLVAGRSFILVEPPQSSDGLPRLYAEDATQMIVAYAPGRRTDRLAALKVWTDEWSGDWFATLYLPDYLHKFRAPAPKAGTATPDRMPRWELRDPKVDGERNTLDEVPVFELPNRPGLRIGQVRSEIADVIPDQDRANHIALNALIAAEYGAFRQKWATGLSVPRIPDPNNPGRMIAVEPFDVAVNRILIAEPNEGGEPAKFGDFNATDLKPYIELYEMTVRHMAAVSQTAVSVLMGTPPNVSAEALALSVSGEVNKARQHMLHREQPLESAMRLAFKSMGDKRAQAVTAETIWRDPEVHSWAQSADAAVKLVQSGVVTAQTAQEMYLGMSQTQRDRDDAWRQAGQLADPLAGLTAMLDAQSADAPADD